MTHESAPGADSPHELLSAVHNLTRQVRLAQRGSWFPLLVFGVITLGAIPMYRVGPGRLSHCRSAAHGTFVCSSVNATVLVYWPIALVLAWVAIAYFYLHQSERHGVGTRIRPYVAVGVAIAVLLAAVSLWRAARPESPSSVALMLGGAQPLSVYSLANPATAIAFALLVLAWVEHNRPLAAYGFVFLVVMVVQTSRTIHSSSQWWFLPQLLLPAGLLLLGSLAFALARPTASDVRGD
jgi:hypothetical protein